MSPNPPVVAFQGARVGRSAFARINARWTGLLERQGFRVVDYDPALAPPDYLIHHDFATSFSAFAVPPGHPRCIAVRTWDVGPLPPVWAEKINREFSQYWAPSRWIAEQARAAGVDPARSHVVPHGVDPQLFTPVGPARELPTSKTFRFLFVGGVSVRKGSDILLEAYRQAFTRDDDVCLVLKDHSGDLFYRDDQVRRRIAELAATPDAPEFLHLDAFLSDTELAALYRACDVAVFPYRAEGFCLPILEAMACGTPAIVPQFGACLDFCTAETSWLTRVRRIRAPVTRAYSVAMGFEEQLAEVDFCEMEVPTLVAALRAAYRSSRAERDAKARAGCAMAAGLSWDAVGERLEAVLKLLPAPNPPLASTGRR